jgi:2'-5' RNA ligase
MAGVAVDAFVVVDMPAAIERHVRAIRQQYGSARQFLPVEITVAGSSGVGVFAPEQDAEQAYEVLRGIASTTGAFVLELTRVERFPKSGVFYFGIKDPTPLARLHARLATSGLLFKPSPYPFSPHLTVDTFDDATTELERELLALPVPEGRHFIESLSVYSLQGWDCRLLRRFPFGRSSS